ncbi:hypothetical protein NA78x_002229 [Anatilimnocola sp. NA78]|uniref:hypothetical protein n=1 Tax=Anatilimnocola sp. NA78 TaxID=3415683 RepID=UPI003CE5C390
MAERDDRPNSPEPVFIDQEYNYRNPLIAVFLIVFTAGSLVIGWSVVQSIPSLAADAAAGKIPKPIAGTVLGILFTLLIHFLTGTLHWMFWFAPRWRVRIDGKGILFGKKLTRWEEISQIGMMTSRSGPFVTTRYLPYFHRRSRWPMALIRGLPLSPALTAEQADGLLNQLSQYLAEHHPHVEVD